MSRLLWKTKVRYHIYKSPLLVPTLSKLNPVCTSPPHSIHILSAHLCRSPKWPFPFRFSDQNFVHISHSTHACYISRPSHPPWFDNPSNIWWSVQVIKLLIKMSSPGSRHFLPLRSKYSPQHPVLRHLQSTSFFQCQRPSFTPIRNKV